MSQVRAYAVRLDRFSVAGAADEGYAMSDPQVFDDFEFVFANGRVETVTADVQRGDTWSEDADAICLTLHPEPGVTDDATIYRRELAMVRKVTREVQPEPPHLVDIEAA